MSHAYSLHNIRFNYAEKNVLSIDQLSIPAQKITALVGANGSGKSTLLNILALLKHPTHGEMHVLGRGLSNSVKKIKRQIAYVPQKPYLFRGTVMDNLKMALRFHAVDSRQHEQVMQQALHELGIQSQANLPAQQLSGGEMQKVALARAVMLKPKILLMDEPFSYLDQGSQLGLETFIGRYVEEYGKTVIFSTHDRLQGRKLASQTLSLVAGSLVQSSLINVFSGQVRDDFFETGKIAIKLSNPKLHSRFLSIEPEDIDVCNPSIGEGEANQFHGRIVAMSEFDKRIKLTVESGEVFQIYCHPSLFEKTNLRLGKSVCLRFKPDRVSVF